METLKLIFDKLSLYNLVTNILPGAVLCIIFKYCIGYDLFVSDNWFLLGILFYFIGMINNRVGSIVLMPLFKWTHFIKLKPYQEYVSAEKKDETITTLSTESTVFRSYTAVCFNSLITMLFKTIADRCVFLSNHSTLLLLILLLLIFAFSYKKQLRFVQKRISIANETKKRL